MLNDAGAAFGGQSIAGTLKLNCVTPRGGLVYATSFGGQTRDVSKVKHLGKWGIVRMPTISRVSCTNSSDIKKTQPPRAALFRLSTRTN